MSNDGERKTIDDLLAVMAALRTPGTGCPWDLEQTFASIAPYTIEEAYEVADAVARGDVPGLKDELGDLLLQVVYHARMAQEEDAFDFGDVVSAIVDKMVRRHPHVFARTAAVASAAETTGMWERIKDEERAEHEGGRRLARGAIEGVPLALPALTRAVKLQRKAARVGFDWPDAGPVLAKVREEFDEVETARASGAASDQLAGELGDVLFALANAARHLGIDPEAALRTANAKFERRFARVEALLAERGRTPEQSDLEEMDGLWDAVKDEEHGGR